MSLYTLAPNTTGSWCFRKEGLYVSPSPPRLLPCPQGAHGLAAFPWGGLASAVTSPRRAETFLRVGLPPPAGQERLFALWPCGGWCWQQRPSQGLGPNRARWVVWGLWLRGLPGERRGPDGEEHARWCSSAGSTASGRLDLGSGAWQSVLKGAKANGRDPSPLPPPAL